MNEENDINKLWNSTTSNSKEEIKVCFGKSPGLFVDLLIKEMLTLKDLQIGIFEDGWQKGANVNLYKSDKRRKLELRLRKNLSYELILSLFDLEVTLINLKHKLSEHEVELLPKELRRLMEAVKELEKPMTFYNTIVE